MMSMKGTANRSPSSRTVRCLEHLADYTDAVTELFSRYGTRGAWYAHASVGCLHVRPILNLKDDGDIRSMRAIAEATCDLVKRFKARIRASMATAFRAPSSMSACSGVASCAPSRR